MLKLSNTHCIPTPRRDLFSLREIFAPERLLAAFQSLEKRNRRGRLQRLNQWDFNYYTILPHAREFCSYLSQEVLAGRWIYTPVRASTLQQGGKKRQLLKASLGDLLIAQVVAEVLSPLVEAQLSDSVHSYRRGRGVKSAFTHVATFARHHRRRVKKNERGLYVCQWDISAYTDSIPLVLGSHLWRKLEWLLQEFSQRAPDEYLLLMDILQQLLRPLIRQSDGSVKRAAQGVPMGSPLTPVVANLYLTDLDHKIRELMRALPASYVRFGDDCLLAAEDALTVLQCERSLQAELQTLGLKVAQNKVRMSYWTGCGRPSRQPGFAAAHALTWLGFSLHFDGAVSLSAKKVRSLQQDFKRRLRAVNWLSAQDQRVQVAVAQARTFFSSNHELRHIYAPYLFSLVNDRRQLKYLDYWIALTCSEFISQQHGPRSFRVCSYRQLKRQHRLPSLVQKRNLGHGD